MYKSATFSECQTYRYVLERSWGEGPTITFCMLNPSTADATNNDPTVERCQRRAKVMGYNSMFIINIFAFRSTDPDVLYVHKDPIGEDNDTYIKMVLKESDMIICGWGKHGNLNSRGSKVLSIIKDSGKIPMALKQNKDGTPSHPLYIGYSVMPKPMVQS